MTGVPLVMPNVHRKAIYILQAELGSSRVIGASVEHICVKTKYESISIPAHKVVCAGITTKLAPADAQVYCAITSASIFMLTSGDLNVNSSNVCHFAPPWFRTLTSIAIDIP